MTRKPAVAGTFYDADKNDLINSVEQSFLGKLGPGRLPVVKESRQGNVLGLVCPHAGYVYSGSAAAYAYDVLASDGLPDTIVLLGPNHYGTGASVALSMETQWQTPLGTIYVDTDTASAILQRSEFVQQDDIPHIKEHSLEVQLPFIQYIGGDRIKIVPIAIAHLDLDDSLKLCSDLGSAIAEALDGKSAVIIASTDFTHYESKERATNIDAEAMEKIINLDPVGLLHLVHEESISMCGAIGTAVMIEACKALGAKHARKLTYYTSGDVTGDVGEVVGYGALSVEKLSSL